MKNIILVGIAFAGGYASQSALPYLKVYLNKQS